jgi:hypothetical protein
MQNENTKQNERYESERLCRFIPSRRDVHEQAGNRWLLAFRHIAEDIPVLAASPANPFQQPDDLLAGG